MSGTTAKTLGMSSTTDLTAHMPSVQMFDAVAAQDECQPRDPRRGPQRLPGGTEAPSVVYVDEFYVLPLAGASIAMYDLERVEALRGPQGTLFGRNATGGLIHFITRKPDLEMPAGTWT